MYTVYTIWVRKSARMPDNAIVFRIVDFSKYAWHCGHSEELLQGHSRIFGPAQQLSTNAAFDVLKWVIPGLQTVKSPEAQRWQKTRPQDSPSVLSSSCFIFLHSFLGNGVTKSLPLLALISSSSSLSIVASLADVEEVEGFQEDFTSSLTMEKGSRKAIEGRKVFYKSSWCCKSEGSSNYHKKRVGRQQNWLRYCHTKRKTVTYSGKKRHRPVNPWLTTVWREQQKHEQTGLLRNPIFFVLTLFLARVPAVLVLEGCSR